MGDVASERERFFELSNDMLCVAGFDGKLQMVNPAWTQTLGWSAEELTSVPMVVYMHPDDVERSLAIRAKIQGGAAVRGFENRYRHKNGGYRWLSWAVYPLMDAKKVFSVARDITERKQAEAEAAWAGRALLMLSRCNEAVIRAESEAWLLNEVCRIAVEVGGARMAAVSFALEDTGKTIEPVAFHGAEDGYLRELQLSWDEKSPFGQGPAGQVIRGGQPVVIGDFDAASSYGPWRERAKARGYQGSISLPLKDKARAFGVLSLYLPVIRLVPHEELQLLQELADNLSFGIQTLRARQRAQEQAALIHQARDAIMVRDLAERLTFWSKGAERLYGWTAEEAVGRNFLSLLRADPDQVRTAVRAVLDKGEWTGELEKIAKSGATLTVDCRWTLVRDANGVPRSILAIDTDVTEQKKIERQFMRAQRMESLGTLAGGIAHDLNNLLAPIVLSVGLIKQMEPDKRVLAAIDMIETSAARGAQLVRQVLSFARGVEGSRVLVHLERLLAEVDSIIGSTFPKNIEIRTLLPKDLWPVMADPTQINQVVLNLCVNARDAMPNGGWIALSAGNLHHDGKPFVVIEVRDNGVGIPKEIIDRIFEPFFTTKDVGKGTGLGLSTVQGILRSHGGQVTVASTKGKGSTFRVYLPAQVQVEEEEELPAAGQLPRGQGELLLLVDDEKPIVEITKQMLEMFGYTVLTALDGDQAMEVYLKQKGRVKLVITDMMMPGGMDGPALVRALLKHEPELPIIGASGLAANDMVAQAAGAGVKHFLAKPYSVESLLQMLQRALKRAA